MRPQEKKLSTSQNSCIAIGRERVTIVSISWNISHFCVAVRWNERLYLLAFLFGGDTEVLEDFSPLSTNATYWKTCQDTLKGQSHRARWRMQVAVAQKASIHKLLGRRG